MTSFTGIFGTALGDILNEAVGMEQTDTEFDERCDAAFEAFDADGSGTLEFGETLEAFRTFPVRRSDEDVRATFDRFDADGSGALDVHEFRALMRALRSSARLDRMPGVIYCGGELVNPSVNPDIANATRLRKKERRIRKMYAEPYAPKSNLAKAVAKPTVRREKMHGGEDVFGRAPFTDSDEDHARMDADRRVGPRVRVSAARGSTTTAPSARRRLAYALLLLARLVACLLPGYVHPDEYHQTVEIAASDALGVRSAPRAWEFEPSRPARSVLGPVVTAGWTYAAARAFAAPMGILARERKFPEGEPPAFASPWIVVLAPRLGAFILSLAVDAAVDRAARAAYWSGPNPTRSGYATAGLDARLVVGSCWATLALQVRPFTNAAEATTAAAATAFVVSRAENTSEVFAAGVLGAVTAVGAWIRFTFPVFVAPLGVRLVLDAARVERRDAPGGGVPGDVPAKRFVAALRVVLAGLFAFFAAAFVLVAIDTRYFRGREGLDAAFAAPFAYPTPWAAAPLNNLLYNLRAENLAKHGIHPRITHAAVNAPALFGPMMCAAYLALARGVRSGCEVCVGHVRAARARATGSGATPSNGDSSSARMDRKDSSLARKDWKDSSFARKDWKDSSFARKDRRDRAARKDRAMLAWMVWFPLVALSTAPHQEPRFLLPLLLPLAATRYAAASGTRARCAAWCALNLAGVVFFGVAHQGGVAPALLALPTLAASNAGRRVRTPSSRFLEDVHPARERPGASRSARRPSRARRRPRRRAAGGGARGARLEENRRRRECNRNGSSRRDEAFGDARDGGERSRGRVAKRGREARDGVVVGGAFQRGRDGRVRRGVQEGGMERGVERHASGRVQSGDEGRATARRA